MRTVSIEPLPSRLSAQLRASVASARKQWQLENPATIKSMSVMDLQRVLLFLRQNGSPSQQAGQVAALAFLFGECLAQDFGWSWCAARFDYHSVPALLSPHGNRVLAVIDIVTVSVLSNQAPSLPTLYRQIERGETETLDSVYAVTDRPA
jgi:hypothetical protein